MKKGFTLIELLAVVAILAILASVGALSYTTIKRRNDQSAEKALKKQIINAAIEYASDFGDEGQTVKYCDLVENGYLEEDLESPLNHKKIGASTTIKIKKDNKGNYFADYTSEFPFTLKFDGGECDTLKGSGKKHIVLLLDQDDNQVAPPITVVCNKYYSLPQLPAYSDTLQFKGWSPTKNGDVLKWAKVECETGADGKERPKYSALYSVYGEQGFMVYFNFPDFLGIESKRIEVEKGKTINETLNEELSAKLSVFDWYDNKYFNGEKFSFDEPITKETTNLYGKYESGDLYKIEFYHYTGEYENGNELKPKPGELIDTIETINPVDLTKSPRTTIRNGNQESVKVWKRFEVVDGKYNYYECYRQDEKINVDKNIKLVAIPTWTDFRAYLGSGYDSEVWYRTTIHSQCDNFSVDDLPIPTKDDYEFLGWYNLDGTKATGNLTKLPALSVFAHWKQYDCRINIYCPGYSSPQKSRLVAENSIYTFTTDDILTCDSASYSSSKGVVFGSFQPSVFIFDSDSDDVKREKNQYMIAYSNVGSPVRCRKDYIGDYYNAMKFIAQPSYRIALMDLKNPEKDPKYIEIGLAYTKTTSSIPGNTYYSQLPTPTKSGYRFLGWYTSSTGGTRVDNGTKYTYTSQTPDALNTSRHSFLYARWKPNNPDFKVKAYTLDGIKNFTLLKLDTNSKPTNDYVKNQLKSIFGTDVKQLYYCAYLPDDYDEVIGMISSNGSANDFCKNDFNSFSDIIDNDYEIIYYIKSEIKFNTNNNSSFVFRDSDLQNQLNSGNKPYKDWNYATLYGSLLPQYEVNGVLNYTWGEYSNCQNLVDSSNLVNNNSKELYACPCKTIIEVRYKLYYDGTYLTDVVKHICSGKSVPKLMPEDYNEQFGSYDVYLEDYYSNYLFDNKYQFATASTNQIIYVNFLPSAYDTNWHFRTINKALGTQLQPYLQVWGKFNNGDQCNVKVYDNMTKSRFAAYTSDTFTVTKISEVLTLDIPWGNLRQPYYCNNGEICYRQLSSSNVSYYTSLDLFCRRDGEMAKIATVIMPSISKTINFFANGGCDNSYFIDSNGQETKSLLFNDIPKSGVVEFRIKNANRVTGDYVISNDPNTKTVKYDILYARKGTSVGCAD